MDKNFLIFVSVEGISSFTRKIEKIYGVEKDEGKLVRLLLGHVAPLTGCAVIGSFEFF